MPSVSKIFIVFTFFLFSGSVFAQTVDVDRLITQFSTIEDKSVRTALGERTAGASVDVSGKVSRVSGRTFLSGPSVNIRVPTAPPQKETTVICNIDDANFQAVPSLKEGDPVTCRGIFNRYGLHISGRLHLWVDGEARQVVAQSAPQVISRGFTMSPLPTKSVAANVAQPTSSKYVVGEIVNVRSCPSTSCGKTGWVSDGEKVTAHEEKSGWTRISGYVDAQCADGISAMIDSGIRDCVPENGVVDNQLARWVSSDFLADNKVVTAAQAPSDCGGVDLSNSDNYRIHKAAFCQAASELISTGRCTASDLREWAWSMSTTKGKDVYFTYCGGAHVSNRLYLNVQSGSISR